MDNLKVHPGLLLPSVNPLPTVLPQESPATPGHCQPTGEAAANAELFSCPKQPPMQIPGGGTPMPLAPGKHRMVGPCLVPHSLAGDAESQSGDEPWWPLF